MLVLTRKDGEFIRIGDTIVVTVVQVYDGKVKVAITAPREIPIVRGELPPLTGDREST